MDETDMSMNWSESGNSDPTVTDDPSATDPSATDSSVADDPPPGSEEILGHIDQYELLKELGTGGFGSVYLARDTVSRTLVAVKGLPAQMKGSAEEMERIRANFALVSRLHHQNIASALVLHPVLRTNYLRVDVAQKLNVKSGQTLMVMEYAPGVTLSRWSRQFPGGRVPLDEAIEVTRQIAVALDFAHRQKIIHRDVKPANVMVEMLRDSSVAVRVLDFGLAAEVHSSQSGKNHADVTSRSGTRKYMSPEQWTGRTQKAPSDQYSLAVLFYELVTGTVPFASVFGCGDLDVMMSVVEKRAPEIPTDLPRCVRKALARALAKDPKERYASCGDFVAALKGKDPFPIKKAALVAGLAAAVALGGWLFMGRGGNAGEQGTAVNQQAFELSSKAESAHNLIGQEPEEMRKFFEAEIRAFENDRRAGNDAKSRSEYAVAVKCLSAALERATALKVKAVEWHRAEKKRKAAEAEAERKKQENLARLRNANSPYKVIDLTDGTVTLLDDAPSGVWTDEYKTDKLVLRRIGAGSFTMGSPDGTNGEPKENGRYGVETQHRVTLTKPYYIGVFEVTQGQWKRVMGGTVIDQARKALQDDTEYLLGGKKQTLRSWWGADRDSDPSEWCGDVTDTVAMYHVNWAEAVQFCEKVGQLWEAGSVTFRLPTEAEWENACRAGATTALPNGQDIEILGERNAPALDAIAWYGGNSSEGFSGRGVDTSGWKDKQYPGGRAYVRKVGTRDPNRWGLYDMLGNVWEWCSDWYALYGGDAIDPKGPDLGASGERRVFRGGSWDINARYCRSANRNRLGPGFRNYYLGFRLACSAGPYE